MDFASARASLVAQLGSHYEQELCKVTKQRQKNVIENLGGCHNMPLIGKGAW